MKKQAQHVVETPAESQGNAELTGKDCPTICPTFVENMHGQWSERIPDCDWEWEA